MSSPHHLIGYDDRYGRGVTLADVQAALTGGTLVAPGAATTRETAVATTASLAASASTTAISMSLSEGFILYSISVSSPARITLYETAAQRDADAARAAGTDPAPDAGVILDFVGVDTAEHALGPAPVGASMEAVPSANIAMRVTNNDTVARAVTVTVTWLKVE